VEEQKPCGVLYSNFKKHIVNMVQTIIYKQK